MNLGWIVENESRLYRIRKGENTKIADAKERMQKEETPGKNENDASGGNTPQ